MDADKGKKTYQTPADRCRIPLTRTDLVQIALAACIIGVVYMIYFELETVPMDNKGAISTIQWIHFRWITGRQTYGNVYYLFAILIPTTSIAVTWRRREALQRAEKKTWWPAWILIVMCLLAHWIGVRTEHPRLSMLSMIGLAWCIPLCLYGWGVARQLIFPCAYLIFCMPLNFLDAFVFRLRVLIARTAAVFLTGLGIPCSTNGTHIAATEAGGFVLKLQPAAAAFGTLLLCFAISALLAVLTQRRTWKQATLFLTALPSFCLATLLAVMAFGLIAGSFGQGLLDRMTDSLLTPLLTLLSFGLIILTAVALRRKVHVS